MYTLEEHESNITEIIGMLNVEGIDQAKLSKIIQGLRDNYSETQTSLTDLSKNFETMKGVHQELKSTNMDLLSKLGKQYSEILTKDKHDIKNPNEKDSSNKGDENTPTTDDIVKNFLGGN
jgi:hypothetical protein